MYLRQCFLRNARKELCLFLSGLDYTPMYMIFRNNIEGNNLVLECGTWHFTDSDNHPNSVDCGENEDLFCAIAALRDDSDKYQWFVDYSTGVPGGSWYMCDLDNIKDCFQSTKLCHKATVNELIKHFNK